MPRSSAPHPCASLACVLAAALLAPSAHAQPRPLKDPTPVPGVPVNPYENEQFLPLFEKLSYEKARAKAQKQNRWLMVWCAARGRLSTMFLERNQASASLRAWIAWHAVSIRETAGVPRRILDQRKKFFTMPGDGDPSVLFIRNDNVEAVVVTTFSGQPTPLRVLYTASIQYDAIAGRDPVWRAMHDHMNPPPQPPDLGPPLHTIDDNHAAAISDPAPGERITVLDRLAEARTLVKTGDLHRATGVYTWLWERGDAFDPSFRPARLTTVASEMLALGRKRAGSMERVVHLRARSERTVLFDEPALVQDHLAITAATDDQAEVIAYLAYFSDDLDEGSITPIGHQTVYSLLARRDPDIISPAELPKNPADRLNRITRVLTRARPTGADPADWSAAQSFAKRYLVDEAARLYGAALIARKPELADQIAATLFAHADTPLARKTLVTTALALDPPHPQPIHTRWLAQAKA
ncbi:MAG: hypothetical protein K2Q20_06365, partial [Phycisphaerales bacterium]|nr:hypothetical protein [Phycisphaerales bacterium]